jgi:RES domain-containing protein
MKLFRCTNPAYASKPVLVDGVGARNGGGRWNPIGVAACYYAETATTSLAEKGFHAIVVEALDFNARLARTRGRRATPKAEIDTITNVELKLTELDVEVETHSLIDISTPASLAAACTRLGASLSFAEAVAGRDLTARYLPTQAFSRLAIASGVLGLIAQSARAVDGRCVVIYPDLVGIGDIYSIGPQQDVSMSCLPSTYVGRYNLRKDGPVATDKILVEEIAASGPAKASIVTVRMN